ncbi:MAG: hypothetical protein ABJQ71_07900 [Roseibium sp.]
MIVSAIGSGTIDVNNGLALDTDTAILITYFDADLGTGSAVIGYVSDLGSGHLLDSSDTINIISSVEMTAVDYANFGSNSLMFG